MKSLNSEKKKILIVEDELINLEMLSMMLMDLYDVIKADNGQKALDAIYGEEDLSLVLLDLNLPDISGLEILRKMYESGRIESLPVVVITADEESEVECLNYGAVDFIKKPYPKPDVIYARIRRIIELVESRIIIGQTENDQLTGLYTKEYFYSYCDRYDTRHPDTDMDAVLININHYHFILERYGKGVAEDVLKRIASSISDLLSETGGYASRRDTDIFLVYMPHIEDHRSLLDNISEAARIDGVDENTVRLRMGVYPYADKDLDVEMRFDRARLASETVRNAFAGEVAIYDEDLNESSKFSDQLLIDCARAIEEEQFTVHFQPKYNIKGEKNVLSSAEALVRWIHPELGFINPGLFIELFERNGLIHQLDRYVWRKAAKQIRDWKDRFGITVPVSVNVSRVDMFDPVVTEELNDIVEEFDLDHRDLILEVTESAYAEDSDHIIATVEKLRELGFLIEMDDFGSGYSSLNMLTELPIDALKLDMQFIRSAFSNGKNTRMVEIVIDIADSLGVPVIAEGVETAEQLAALKSMGCDVVQGYYFSKPVPAESFEGFLSGGTDK